MTAIQQHDMRSLLTLAIAEAEHKLTLAQKQRSVALDKLKKVQARIANPKARFKHQEAVNVANCEVAAWERRLEMAQRMIKGVE